MKKSIKTIGLVFAVILTSGCSTMVAFKSEPSGATVTCDNCRGWGSTDTKTPIGVTPFKFEVMDKFGWFSQYKFTATKEGYKSATQTVEEKTIVDGTTFGFFPNEINFKLNK
jgi:hypothetical protein